MNAGTDYTRARRQAQANADYFDTNYRLFQYNNTWWVERADTPASIDFFPSWAGVKAEIITPKITKDAA